MRIIGILTALAISFASPSKNAATLERDTRALATLDCKLLDTATKVEAVPGVDREAKIAKEMPKRTRFLLQLRDNLASSTSLWLLRNVTSPSDEELPVICSSLRMAAAQLPQGPRLGTGPYRKSFLKEGFVFSETLGFRCEGSQHLVGHHANFLHGYVTHNTSIEDIQTFCLPFAFPWIVVGIRSYSSKQPPVPVGR